MASISCLFHLIAIFVLPVTGSLSVCYRKYGCFNENPPFNRRYIPLPQRPVDMGMVYRLATRADPTGNTIINDHDAAKLKASGYDGSKKTIIIIHGWNENPMEKWIKNMQQALIKKEDVNVIVAGWKEGAKQNIFLAVGNTRLIGSMVAELIKFINRETRNNPSSFHLIGFSLGAHISGYVGRRLKAVKLGRITGLDPAGPYYVNTHIDVRLDPSDANFVDVIHTDADLAGIITKSGHLDFWPNGGAMQRGCEIRKGGSYKDFLKCDHLRAPEYYVESIPSQCTFRSYRCSSWDQFTRGNCMTCGSNSCPEMGHNAITYKGLGNGNFYLYTNKAKPFCGVHFAFVTFKTSGGFDDKDHVQINIHGTKGSTGNIILPSRHFKAGSIVKFVVPIKDIGTLTSIDLSHFNIFEIWMPDSVQIVLNNNKSYTACYKGSTVYVEPVNKNLKPGTKTC